MLAARAGAPPPRAAVGGHTPDADGALRAVLRLGRGDVKQRLERAHRQAGVAVWPHHCVGLARAGLAVGQQADVVTVGA